jgi:hypothetical protein
MNEYIVKYFDCLDWAYKSERYLSRNEEELINHLNNHVLKAEFRERDGKDSLEIEVSEENVTIPYHLGEY